MMIDEFKARVKSRKPDNDPNFDYEIIELVYAFHPLLDCDQPKDEIAKLYDFGGMALMNDMLPRAKAAKEKADEIAAIRGEIDALQKKLNSVQDELDALKES